MFPKWRESGNQQTTFSFQKRSVQVKGGGEKVLRVKRESDGIFNSCYSVFQVR